jgi:ABC-type transport system substrate-binding protein
VPTSGSGMQDPVAMGTAIQGYLAAVGIKVTITQQEWGTYGPPPLRRTGFLTSNGRSPWGARVTDSVDKSSPHAAPAALTPTVTSASYAAGVR